MAQVIHANGLSVATSMERKTYAVNIKGLIAHLLDILFVEDKTDNTYYSSELSDHMQRDVGIRR